MFSLLKRFTYRQRFAFLGILFFIFGIPAVYLTVKSLHYSIQNKQQQLLIIDYQRSLSQLLSLLENKETKPHTITQQLDLLAQLQDQAHQQKKIVLGPGFASITIRPLNLSNWKHATPEELKLSIQSMLQRLAVQQPADNEEEIQRQNTQYGWMLRTLYITLAMGFLVVAFYLIKRLISSHLRHLSDHIERMAQGHLAPCFCSNDKDGFGQVGRALDKISGVVTYLAQRMHTMGDKVADTSQQISQTTHEQEFYIHGQELQIAMIESVAQELSQTQRSLSNKTQEYSLGNSSTHSAEKVTADMALLQSHIHTLLNNSATIVTLLAGLEEKVLHSATMSAFMTKVSDSANLLALNASIETANLTQNRESFAAISQKIQRFAENTAVSSTEIKNIVQVMLENVSIVKTEALVCLKEINAGGQQLMDISLQFAQISQESREQIEKFNQLTHFIQRQADAMERILQDIALLKSSAKNNKALILTLHQTLNLLNDTAIQLKLTLGTFQPNKVGATHG